MTTSIPQPIGVLSRFLARRFYVTRQGAFLFIALLAVFMTARPTSLSLVVGGLFSAAGELLRIITAGYGYTVGEVSRRGPYRFVRHPYFLGTALLTIGLTVTGRNAWVVATLLTLMALVMQEDVRMDELRFRRVFGPAFDLYRAQVPAFIPRLWAIAREPGDQRQFSMERAVLKGRHRELDAVLGLVMAFAWLYVLKQVANPSLFHAGAFVFGILFLVARMLYVAIRKPARIYQSPIETPGN